MYMYLLSLKKNFFFNINLVDFYCKYSASSLIRTSIIRILAYPNSQKQDYNIIHKHFNIVIELSVIYFSMYFTYLNFSVIRTKLFLACTKGFR